MLMMMAGLIRMTLIRSNKALVPGFNLMDLFNVRNNFTPVAAVVPAAAIIPDAEPQVAPMVIEVTEEPTAKTVYLAETSESELPKETVVEKFC